MTNSTPKTNNKIERNVRSPNSQGKNKKYLKTYVSNTNTSSPVTTNGSANGGTGRKSATGRLSSSPCSVSKNINRNTPVRYDSSSPRYNEGANSSFQGKSNDAVLSWKRKTSSLGREKIYFQSPFGKDKAYSNRVHKKIDYIFLTPEASRKKCIKRQLDTSMEYSSIAFTLQENKKRCYSKGWMETVMGSPTSNFYAGAKFSEPPSPTSLPKPPSHWTSMLVKGCQQEAKDYHMIQNTSSLKMMLNVQA